MAGKIANQLKFDTPKGIFENFAEETKDQGIECY